MCQEENKRESKKYFELKENENTTYKNAWGVAKAALWGKFIALKLKVLEKNRGLKSMT